ncbi:MAG: hypothetical protein Q8R28_12085 [Dehalococcoidia bacterium]|nr:hypothetical protein [Dehalococcoidia bacterium]
MTLLSSPGDSYSNVALEVYAVAASGGSTKIDTAGTTATLGLKRALFNLSVAGTYVVVVHNWDSLGRAVHFDITATNAATGQLVPCLTQIK